jgi:hypothetical protein
MKDGIGSLDVTTLDKRERQARESHLCANARPPWNREN